MHDGLHASIYGTVDAKLFQNKQYTLCLKKRGNIFLLCFLNSDKFYAKFKLITCLSSATYLVQTDGNIAKKQPKVDGVFLWTTQNIKEM